MIGNEQRFQTLERLLTIHSTNVLPVRELPSSSILIETSGRTLVVDAEDRVKSITYNGTPNRIEYDL